MTDLTKQLEKENVKLKTENKWYSEQLNKAVKEMSQLKEELKECRKFYQKMYSLNIINSCSLPYEEWKKVYECVTSENKEITVLKELLKECELWFTGTVDNMNDKNVGEHNKNLPIGNFEHTFKVFSQKINQILEGDK